MTIDHDYVDDTLENWTYILTEDTLPAEMLNTSSGNSCLDGGGDVRFSSDSAGNTRLACDIRACHPTAGGTGAYADIAVKVPSVSSSSDTTIYIWYEKSGETQPAASDTYGQYNAYDASYEGVWPLNSTAATDRTLNQTAVSESGTPSYGAGSVYNAMTVDGVSEGITSDSSNIAVFESVSFTVEVLAKRGTLTDPNGAIVCYTDGTKGYELCCSSVGDIWWAHGRKWAVNSTGHTLSNSGLENIALIYATASGTTVRHNGTEIDSDATSGDMTYTGTRKIGIGLRHDTDGVDFCGAIDEVRISSTNRSIAWVDAVYNNLCDPTSFTTVGTPATP